MTLKYSDRPVVNYHGSNRSRFDIAPGRFPQGVQPVKLAPENTTIVGYESDGSAHLAHRRGDSWRKLVEERDPKTGRVTLRENGDRVNPVMYALPRRRG